MRSPITISVSDGFHNVSAASLDRKATLHNGVILKKITRDEILSRINMSQLEGDIAEFQDKMIKAEAKHAKAATWLQIADMAGMELEPEQRYVNTYSGRFLVKQFIWRR